MQMMIGYGHIIIIACRFKAHRHRLRRVPDTKTQRFVKSLVKLSKFEVRLGRFQKIQNGLSAEYVQKGIDVMLAVDLVKMSWGKQIDKAILLAADSDFIYAIQAAKDAGVSTKLCYSDRHPVNDSMLDVFDDRVVVTNELFGRCVLSPPQDK